MDRIGDITECNDILNQGFPEDEFVLQKMPFGFSMLAAYNKKDPSDPDKYLHRRHLIEIVKKMNLLLGGNIRETITDQNESEDTFIVGAWVNAWKDIYGEAQTTDVETQPWGLKSEKVMVLLKDWKNPCWNAESPQIP